MFCSKVVFWSQLLYFKGSSFWRVIRVCLYFVHKTGSLHDIKFLNVSVICLYRIWCCKNNQNLEVFICWGISSLRIGVMTPTCLQLLSFKSKKTSQNVQVLLVSLLSCQLTPQNHNAQSIKVNLQNSSPELQVSKVLCKVSFKVGRITLEKIWGCVSIQKC